MPLKKVSVDQHQIQKVFNQHYLPAYKRGDLTTVIVSRNPPDPASNQPKGTESQMWAVYDKAGNYIGRTHQYVKPDGSLSASGLPDPKEVIVGQTRYVLVKAPPPTPPKPPAKAGTP